MRYSRWKPVGAGRRVTPMHELAVCQALLQEVERIVAERSATAADRVVVAVGPLSGVEPALLANAFTIARQGTPAANAALEIETVPVEIECGACGHRGGARANRLLCGACGGWQVRVVRGEDLMLMRVDLLLGAAPSAQPDPNREAARHV